MRSGIDNAWEEVTIPAEKWYRYHLISGIDITWKKVSIPVEKWYWYHLRKGISIDTTWSGIKTIREVASIIFKEWYDTT